VIEGVTASPSRSFRVPVYSPLSPPLLLYFFGPKPKKSGQLDLNRVDARSLVLQFAHQSVRTGSPIARVGPTHAWHKLKRKILSGLGLRTIGLPAPQA
jgi:hypothetical protein